MILPAASKGVLRRLAGGTILGGCLLAMIARVLVSGIDRDHLGFGLGFYGAIGVVGAGVYSWGSWAGRRSRAGS
jgi:hypothetical protein